MYPDLIDIGFLHVKTYGALMATGFIVCWWLVERLSGRKDLSNLLMLLMLGGVVGSLCLWITQSGGGGLSQTCSQRDGSDGHQCEKQFFHTLNTLING